MEPFIILRAIVAFLIVYGTLPVFVFILVFLGGQKDFARINMRAFMKNAVTCLLRK